MKKTVLLFFTLLAFSVQSQTTVPQSSKLAITKNIKQNNATRIIVQDSITKELNWVLRTNLYPTIDQVLGAGNTTGKSLTVGSFTSNYVYPRIVQFPPSGGYISSTGGGNRFLRFTPGGLSSDMPYYFDFTDVNLQPANFMTGSIFGVEKFKITRDGKMVIADGVASNEAITVGQLNAISGDFIAKTGNTILNPITGDLHSTKGFKSVWYEGVLDLGSDFNPDYRQFTFRIRGTAGSGLENTTVQMYVNPEEGFYLGNDNDVEGTYNYQLISRTFQQSYIENQGETNITNKTVDNTTFSKPIIINNPTGNGIISNGFEAIIANGEDVGVRATATVGTGIIASGDTGIIASGYNGGIFTGENIGIDVNGSYVGLNATGQIGISAYGYEEGVIASGILVGIQAYSETDAGVAGSFNVYSTHTGNIADFKKGGTIQVSITHDGKINCNGLIASNGTIRLKNYTVATLPTGTQGDTAYVTNALMPTYMATVVGGGNIVTPVFFNGVNWVVR